MSIVKFGMQDNLIYAIEHGMIDLPKLEAEVYMDKCKQYLDQHPYSIWRGKNGSWYTHIPCESSSSGRKKIKRNSREKVEAAIVEYYSKGETVPTFGKCFMEQQAYVLSNGKITRNTYDRKQNDYERFIKGSKFDKTPINIIQENTLVMFLDDVMREYQGQIARKAFNNLKSLIGGVFVYAKVIKRYDCIYTKELLASYSPTARQFKKKEKKIQVFNNQEIDLIIDIIIKEYWNSIRHLGLLFMLFTGVRVGELALIKLSAFVNEHKIYIQRTISKGKDEQGRSHRIISDYPKTEYSDDYVLLSDDALKVVSQVMKLREQAGEDSEWLFAENGEYISDNKFDKTIRKLCKELDIPVRSCHKLRKTYCSYLLDSGVDEKLVQEQLRHSDIRTTQNHYHYSVKIENEKLTAINTDCKLGNVI